MPNSDVLYKTTLRSSEDVIDYLQKHVNNLTNDMNVSDTENDG